MPKKTPPTTRRAVVDALLRGTHYKVVAQQQQISETTVRRIRDLIGETVAKSTEKLSAELILSKLEGYLES